MNDAGIEIEMLRNEIELLRRENETMRRGLKTLHVLLRRLLKDRYNKKTDKHNGTR